MLILLLGSLALFGGSLSHEFVFDDLTVVRDNLALRTLAGLPRLFLRPYPTSLTGLYRPLTMATFSLNVALGGPTPWSFHLVNVLLHALTSFFAVILFRVLTGERRLSLWAGAWFFLLPIHTEAIANVVGRADLLTTALSLLTLILLIGPAVRPGTQRPPTIGRSAGTGVLFLLALLSKEQAIATVPIYVSWVLLEARRQLRRPLDALWAVRRQLAWLCVGLAAYLGFRFLALGPHALAGDNTATIVENPLAHTSTLVRIVTALKILTLYLEKSLWPVTLSSDYAYNQIPLATGLGDVRVLVGIAAVGWLLWMLGRPRLDVRDDQRMNHAAHWGIVAALFFWPWLPASNLLSPIGTNMGERLMYFPSVGLCLMLGMITQRFTACLPRRGAGMGGQGRAPALLRRIVVWMVVAGVIGGYGWRCVRRTQDWRNERTLFLSALAASPNSIRARTNAAVIFLNDGNVTRAEELLASAHRIYPRYFFTEHHLGLVYFRQHRYELAEQQFLTALRLLNEPRVYVNLARVYLAQGRVEDARAALRKRYAGDDAMAEVVLKRLLEPHQ